MPWKELCALDLRIGMITDWLSKEYSITELSRRYCVSRKTVYKWIERYQELGTEGLEELSRAPHHCPQRTPEEIVEVLLEMKCRKMNWGPKKILAKLRNGQPGAVWPADSTGHDILKRHGFVKSRKYRHHTPPYTEPFLGCDAPNQVWSADYKGHFKLGNGRRCYPLTISDNCTRYLVGCWGLSRTTFEQTKPCFERVFHENGLPDAIRTDNGSPFASVGLGGLSRLSVWFIQLGIRPERIQPGCPEQNGRHERMHRTLKAETASPPKGNMQAQQKAFNRFLREYNYERPHEALGQKPPASFYHPTPRPFPGRLPKVEYDAMTTVRYVHPNGCITWHGDEVYSSQSLAREYVGFQQIADGLWTVVYSFHHLGIFDERTNKIQPY